MVTHVNTKGLPPPAGHYSSAAYLDGMLFISGQLPVGSDGTPPAGMARSSFGDQAAGALRCMLSVLREAGGEPSNLVKVTAYIVGIQHWRDFDEIYAGLLGAALPARTVIPVPELHFGCLVEVDAIAGGIRLPRRGEA